MLIHCQETRGVRAIVDAAEHVLSEFTQEEDGGGVPSADVHEKPGRPKGGVRERRSLLYRQIHRGRWLLVLDHLCSSDSDIRRVLEHLFDYDVLAIGASRGRGASDLGNVAKTVWRWNVVKIPPLEPAACHQLLEYLTCPWPSDGNLCQVLAPGCSSWRRVTPAS